MVSARLQLRPLKKSVFSISLLTFILCACYPAGSNASYPYTRRSNDVTDNNYQRVFKVGKINNATDILLYHDVARSDGKWHFAKEDITYPPQVTSERSKVIITMINVTDLMPQGEWGKVTVMSGGVGQTKVKLRLKARSGNRYFFNVDIWGYFV